MKKIPKWKHRLHEVIYEADTPAGKWFDLLLLFFILLSVIFVMLESVGSIDAKYHDLLDVAEWTITILFTVEYILRIISVQKPWRYVTSFFGIVDLLAMLPKYISLVITGTQGLVAIRALRLLRVFRILKLTRYVGEGHVLMIALRKSRPKIFVFLSAVFILCIIFGSIMYLIEGSKSGFTSIPRSVYWCVVTMTTVGYGDIAPTTPLGQSIAAFIMILGYGIIAVPTGIVTAQLSKNKEKNHNTQACPHCMYDKHGDKAIYCQKCGGRLNPDE
ncbi:MAG: ion transporter [Flavobacteriaceae bacterium]|nr:ion transporter [Flavobacteriaceae bacterium]